MTARHWRAEVVKFLDIMHVWRRGGPNAPMILGELAAEKRVVRLSETTQTNVFSSYWG